MAAGAGGAATRAEAGMKVKRMKKMSKNEVGDRKIQRCSES